MLKSIVNAAKKNLPSTLAATEKIQNLNPKPLLNKPESNVEPKTTLLSKITGGLKGDTHKRIIDASKPIPQTESSASSTITRVPNPQKSGVQQPFVKEQAREMLQNKRKQLANEVKERHDAAHERAMRRTTKSDSISVSAESNSIGYLEEIAKNLRDIKKFLFDKEDDSCSCKTIGDNIMDKFKRNEPDKLRKKSPYQKTINRVKDKVFSKKDSFGKMAKKSSSKMGSLFENVGKAKKLPSANLAKGVTSIATKSPVLGTAMQSAKGLFSSGGAIARAAGTILRLSSPAMAVAAAGYAGWELGKYINKSIEGTDIGKKKDDLFDSIFAGIDKVTDGLIGGGSEIAKGMEVVPYKPKNKPSVVPIANPQPVASTPPIEQNEVPNTTQTESIKVTPIEQNGIQSTEQNETPVVKSTKEVYSSAKSSLANVIKGGESGKEGYDAYNRGTSGNKVLGSVGHRDLQSMSIGEVMADQKRSKADTKRLFAVGKYQLIPETLQSGVKALGMSSDTKFDAATQEKLFSDYLLDKKRPQISSYIKDKGGSAQSAQIAAAQEWASIADPRTGKSFYDKSGGNHSSISSDKILSSMNAAKTKYKEFIAKGMSDNEAYSKAVNSTMTQDATGGGTVAGGGNDVTKKTSPDVTTLTNKSKQINSDIKAPKQGVSPVTTQLTNKSNKIKSNKGGFDVMSAALGYTGNTLTGLTEAETRALAAETQRTESQGKISAENANGYIGKYQFGSEALAESGLVDKEKAIQAKKAAGNKNWYNQGGQKAFLENDANWTIAGGKKAFMSNSDIQDKAYSVYTNKNIKAGMKSGAISTSDSPEKIAAYTKAAHLKGVGGANKLFKQGVDSQDGNGTGAKKYATDGTNAIKNLAPLVQQTLNTGGKVSPVKPVVSDGATQMGDATTFTKNTKAKVTSPDSPKNGGTGAQNVGNVSTANSMGLRVKGQQAVDGGNTKAGTLAMAKVLQDNVSGIKQFTAFDDGYHHSAKYMGGNPKKHSAHHDGRAMDFTLQNPTNAAYAKAAGEVRGLLEKNNINAKVIDEANHPSSKATGAHIHVQLATDEDVAKAHALYSGQDPSTVGNKGDKGAVEAAKKGEDVAGVANKAMNADALVTNAKTVTSDDKLGETKTKKPSGTLTKTKNKKSVIPGGITKNIDTISPIGDMSNMIPDDLGEIDTQMATVDSEPIINNVTQEGSVTEIAGSTNVSDLIGNSSTLGIDPTLGTIQHPLFVKTLDGKSEPLTENATYNDLTRSFNPSQNNNSVIGNITKMFSGDSNSVIGDITKMIGGIGDSNTLIKSIGNVITDTSNPSLNGITRPFSPENNNIFEKSNSTIINSVNKPSNGLLSNIVDGDRMGRANKMESLSINNSLERIDKPKTSDIVGNVTFESEMEKSKSGNNKPIVVPIPIQQQVSSGQQNPTTQGHSKPPLIVRTQDSAIRRLTDGILSYGLT